MEYDDALRIGTSTTDAMDFWDNLLETNFQDPEKNLLKAILEDAVICSRFDKDSSQKKLTLRREARQWIMANDEKYLFSFLNIMAALVPNYDINRARRAAFAQPVIKNKPHHYAGDNPRKTIGA